MFLCLWVAPDVSKNRSSFAFRVKQLKKRLLDPEYEETKFFKLTDLFVSAKMHHYVHEDVTLHFLNFLSSCLYFLIATAA